MSFFFFPFSFFFFFFFFLFFFFFFYLSFFFSFFAFHRDAEGLCNEANLLIAVATREVCGVKRFISLTLNSS